MITHRIAKKIEYMHMRFGKEDGKICGDCSHLIRYRAGKRIHAKCTVYGVTPSSSSDWNSRYEACGACCCEDGESDARTD